jgi:hypothetical protein
MSSALASRSLKLRIQGEDDPVSQPAPGRSQEPAALKSLAPEYDEAQHKTYVDRLDAALSDPRNRNIALSGPYGTGKSSVLDKFQEERENSTLRLAISTLAPDAEGATLTNRIQKEVLKQLVYSARPSTLRHSRFSRRRPLSWWQAAGESAAAVGVLGALLTMLGRLPSQVATGTGHSTMQRAAVWATVAALLIVTGTVLRKVTYRFVVSDVSAAGASLKLSEAGNTYFDEHLDEILYFFDEESKDVVIFEDLDRYNDPQIFQALRELNTLLNNTPKRRDKIIKDQTPLRFVYAMRDSLFEKIGEDTAEVADDDAARAENIRANRTKFFEVVIPVVPFISHRTAREHLHQLLREAGIAGVDRALVELVAKHAIDMRLLVNMRNEYLVFAERLLKSDKVAPELSASHLFALIAYKNFHLQDFENIARRASDLDRLYDYHRELVATSVEDREQAQRGLLSKNSRPQAIGPFAKKFAERLQAVGTFARDRNGRSGAIRFNVDSKQYDLDEAGTPEFWDAVVRTGSVALSAVSVGPLGTMDQGHLESLFPEVLKGRWAERNAEAVQEELRELSREVDLLRGADFQDLAETDQFKLSVPVTAEGGIAAKDSGSVERADLTFAELVHRTLKSDLARDLVKHGYIDQNFTLYAAQFYGDFTGVDVATFIVQTVQTNSIDINYRFTSAGALQNLLAEAGDDLTRTVSAFNIQLMDYLLDEDVNRANEVVEHLTSSVGNDQKSFLSAFFTSAEQRTQLAAQLSRRPWPGVFTYLVADDGVPTDVRTRLVDAALLAAVPTGAYDVGPEVGDFLVAHYTEMAAFTEAHTRAELEAVVAMLRRAEVLLPTPAGVHEDLRTLLVENDLYELTADSLRAALGVTGAVTLDEVQANAAVYAYCLANLGTYLDAVEADDATDFAVRSSKTLVRALEAAKEDEGAVERLTATSSPGSSLRRLTDAPESSWPALAAAKLFSASLVNLEAYRAEVGDIDEHLGGLLVSAGAIDTMDDAEEGADVESEEADHVAVAVAVLNASRGIPSPENRVRLAASLTLPGPLQAGQISPEESNLFALLIERGLIPDEASTFTRLRAGGQAAVMPAIVASGKVAEFLTPDLVSGMVAAVFATPDVSAKVGQQMLGGLAEFVPTDEAKPLAAAAKFAVHSGSALPVEQIHRVARTCGDAALTVRLLALAAPTGSDVAAVLADLGGKYSYVSTWEQNEFEVPDDEPHNTVFKILAEANLCRSGKKRGKPFLVIKRP